ncbi:hypothetical protein Dda_2755 [Drechslerella dactyloides]|uniref:Uncharacterized protein n=1 Tax=Drechslerella dactyloides TaxID=74499 RepID=A0AAD6NJP2_DREDA|nr:hypothetical protein Dda_2755 [Drechslerella dactyloides]
MYIPYGTVYVRVSTPKYSTVRYGAVQYTQHELATNWQLLLEKGYVFSDISHPALKCSQFSHIPAARQVISVQAVDRPREIGKWKRPGAGGLANSSTPVLEREIAMFDSTVARSRCRADSKDGFEGA